MNRAELLAALELVRDLHSRLEKALEETDSTSKSSEDEYVGTSKAKTIAGVSATTLYKWARTGAIEGGRTREGDGPWRFSKQSLLKVRMIKSGC